MSKAVISIYVVRGNMDWTLFWTAFGAIGGTFGALATAVAVIVALWQTKYSQKRRSKFPLMRMLQLFPKSEAPFIDM